MGVWLIVRKIDVDRAIIGFSGDSVSRNGPIRWLERDIVGGFQCNKRSEDADDISR